MKNKKIIGLIGGMGPFASARFLQTMLEKSCSNFGAKNGNDFPEIVLDSIPVPDFISNTSRLPEAEALLISRIKKLDKFGCKTVAMVCNTGHILFPKLSRTSNAKMISLIKAVRSRVIELKLKRVGILATKTTLNSNIYKQAFSRTGIKIINPDEEIINVCEGVIRKVIANENTKSSVSGLIAKTISFAAKQKLDGIILGCTELPLAFPKDKKFKFKVIDCLDVLSDSLLNDAFDGIEIKT
ncbi:MAG: amino acid racemase [Patescibacteria group bacterium]